MTESNIHVKRVATRHRTLVKIYGTKFGSWLLESKVCHFWLKREVAINTLLALSCSLWWWVFRFLLCSVTSFAYWVYRLLRGCALYRVHRLIRTIVLQTKIKD